MCYLLALRFGQIFLSVLNLPNGDDEDSVCACVLSHFSYVQLFVMLWTVGHKVPVSMGFSRQEYWSGLPFPFSGDLPNPRTEPTSPSLAGRLFTANAIWEAQ